MARTTTPGWARPLKLYATGHAVLLVGATASHVIGSMLPLALAASACLMLTMPIVRRVVAAAAARR